MQNKTIHLHLCVCLPHTRPQRFTVSMDTNVGGGGGREMVPAQVPEILKAKLGFKTVKVKVAGNARLG